MNTIIFSLIFYFCFTALVGLGQTIYKSYKWYQIILIVLFGWVIVPVTIGILLKTRK